MLLTQGRPQVDEPTADDLYQIGTLSPPPICSCKRDDGFLRLSPPAMPNYRHRGTSTHGAQPSREKVRASGTTRRL